MLIGVSVYDLNEYHIAESRARVVPLAQTIRDIRESQVEWDLSQRLLNQYLLSYVRMLFPTVGFTSKVHVALRARARALLGLQSAAEDEENALVLPSQPILEFGDSTKRVTDWDSARLIRRVSLLRLENRGRHVFDGPKQLAFRRMLREGAERGQVIIVVLPVTEVYEREFLTREVKSSFEAALVGAREQAPASLVIRLDRIHGLGASEYFSDLVHLNAAGRRLATDAFLAAVPADVGAIDRGRVVSGLSGVK